MPLLGVGEFAGDEAHERLGGHTRALHERGGGALSPASRREPAERVRESGGHPRWELGRCDELVRDARSRRREGVQLGHVHRDEFVTSRVEEAPRQGPPHEIERVLRGRRPASFTGDAPGRPEE